MEMKWHPIVNGDLSGIQQQEDSSGRPDVRLEEGSKL